MIDSFSFGLSAFGFVLPWQLEAPQEAAPVNLYAVCACAGTGARGVEIFTPTTMPAATAARTTTTASRPMPVLPFNVDRVIRSRVVTAAAPAPGRPAPPSEEARRGLAAVPVARRPPCRSARRAGRAAPSRRA